GVGDDVARGQGRVFIQIGRAACRGRRVVDAGDGDGDRGLVAQSVVYVLDLVGETVGRAVADHQGIERAVGVVGEAAVGIDRQLGAGSEGDLATDVGGQAIDLGHL